MTWTPPQHVERGEASSAQWNTEVVANIADLNTRTTAVEAAPYAVEGAVRAGTFSRTASTYGDPDGGVGAGPAVTVATNTEALVTIGVKQWSAGSELSFAVSGASTVAAGTAGYLTHSGTGLLSIGSFGRTFHVTGLTPGSNTFTVKYKGTGSAGAWIDPAIIVQTL